jgi:hypothetical protein
VSAISRALKITVVVSEVVGVSAHGLDRGPEHVREFEFDVAQLELDDARRSVLEFGVKLADEIDEKAGKPISLTSGIVGSI